MISKKILLSLAFLEGGLVMLLELVIPHVLAPILGNSIEMWAQLILLSVGGLALGYFFGAYLSKNEHSLKLIFLFLACFITSMISFSIIVYFNNYQLFSNEITTAYFIAFFGLFLPTLALASTTPIIINEYCNNTNSAGLIFYYSTLGGIFFTILVGFWSIPVIGLISTLRVLLFLLSFMIIMAAWKSTIQSKRVGLICLVLSMFTFFGSSEISSKEGIEIVEMSEGLNGQLMVVDNRINDTINERTLFINRMGQTWIRIVNDVNVSSLWSYPAIIKSLASYHGRQHSRALILGLGGGIIPLFLSDKVNLNYSIDAVELDKGVAYIAKNHFFLDQNVNVIEDDARRFLNYNDQKYDLIVMDVFNGEIAPSHVLSKEAFELVDKALSERGFIIINFNGHITGKKGISAKSLIKTLYALGFNVDILPSLEKGENNRNNLIIVSKAKLDYNKLSLPITYTKNNKVDIYDVRKNLINLKSISLTNAKLISDNFPIMEQLNQEAARQWREDYLKNITLTYRSKGIPLIK
jgi:hypothetical protein